MQQEKPYPLFYQQKIECPERENECSHCESGVNERAPDTFDNAPGAEVHLELQKCKYLVKNYMQDLRHLRLILGGGKLNEKLLKIVRKLLFHRKKLVQAAGEDDLPLVYDPDISTYLFHHIQAVC